MPGNQDPIDEEYKPQNANTATTRETGLDTVYACVTMIDVAEGDSYVVDLKHELDPEDPEDPRAWRRYLIDAGKKKKEITRLEAICNSLYRSSGDHIKLGGPWDETARTGGTYGGANIPPLSGIIITHSDADHAGGAPAVLERLSSLSAAQTPANNIPGYPVPVMMSPMWLWTTDIITKTNQSITNKKWGSLQDCCEIKATPHPKGDNFLEDVVLRVDYKNSAGYSVSKSWQSLDELAKQAGYRVMFRFNLITEAKPDAKEAFTVVGWERIKSDHGMKDFVQSPESSLTKLCNVNANAPKDAEPQLLKKLADLLEKYGENVKILVEVILRPRPLGFDIKRTLAPSSYTQDDIAGCWLRTAVELKTITDGLLNEENDERGQDLKPGIKQVLMTGTTGKTEYQDTNDKKQDPDFKPFYQVIGLDDDLTCLPFATPAGKTDNGLWSETRLGCAGSDYVRDFAHFILQYKLPKPIKPKKKKEADATDPATDPTQTVDGDDDDDDDDEALKSVSEFLKKYNVEQASQDHWAEYANRASIITHFIYDDP